MKRVTMSLAWAVLAIVLSHGEAMAQMGHGMMGGSGSGMGPMGRPACGRMGCQDADLMQTLHQWGMRLFVQKDQLGLADDQVDQIQSILNSHRKYAIPKNAERKVLFIEIQELLTEDKVNLSKVEGKVKDMERLNADMAMEGIRAMEAAMAVLNPEQQKEAKSFFKQSVCMQQMGMQGTETGTTEKKEAMCGHTMKE
jgi:Spy/CpxP family protein refolding chaperone